MLRARRYVCLAILWCGCGSVDEQQRTDAREPDAAAASPDAGLPGCDGADADLVACFAAEPASPSNRLTDSSSYANHGTLAGVQFVEGRQGMALETAAGATLVTVPESTSLDVTTGLTLAAWVRPQVVPAGGTRARVLDNDGQYALMVTDANRVLCAVVTSAAVELETTVDLAIGAWTHVACTYAQADARLIIYLDGHAVASRATSADAVRTAGTTGIVIGGKNPCAAAPCVDPFVGRLDELRIWKRALAGADVCALAGC